MLNHMVQPTLSRQIQKNLPKDHTIILLNFQATPDFPAALRTLGYDEVYIVFGPNVTFSKLERVMGEVAFDCPPDRLLICSDAPFTIPATMGGGRREYSTPGHVGEVALRLAALRRQDPKELVQLANMNATRLFGLPALSSST
mmetsp:Transcript_40645/g.63480  ORF Transcript_40645/g.63480 Transcript_40645/m.63480 type:complete len:143 (+) Transcript_40645:396-824(+)